MVAGVTIIGYSGGACLVAVVAGVAGRQLVYASESWMDWYSAYPSLFKGNTPVAPPLSRICLRVGQDAPRRTCKRSAYLLRRIGQLCPGVADVHAFDIRRTVNQRSRRIARLSAGSGIKDRNRNESRARFRRDRYSHRCGIAGSVRIVSGVMRLHLIRGSAGQRCRRAADGAVLKCKEPSHGHGIAG